MKRWAQEWQYYSRLLCRITVFWWTPMMGVSESSRKGPMLHSLLAFVPMSWQWDMMRFWIFVIISKYKGRNAALGNNAAMDTIGKPWLHLNSVTVYFLPTAFMSKKPSECILTETSGIPNERPALLQWIDYFEYIWRLNLETRGQSRQSTEVVRFSFHVTLICDTAWEDWLVIEFDIGNPPHCLAN